MLKRLTIVLLAILAILAGLYQLRTQLLISALNIVVADADARVDQLEGLTVGWRGVSADKLVLAIGNPETRQVMLGVHLSYSVLDIEPHTLIVNKAILAVPKAKSSPQKHSPPFLASKLWDQLLASPLHSLTVHELELRGLSDKLTGQNISLNINWGDDWLLLEAGDSGSKTISLEIHRQTMDELLLSVDLLDNDYGKFHFEAAISQRQSRVFLQATGRGQVAPLLSSAGVYTSLPTWLTGVAGELVFELSGNFEDDLSRWAGGQWQLQVLPESNISSEITNPNIAANLQLNVTDSLTASIEPLAGGEPVISLLGGAIDVQVDERNIPLGGHGELTAISCTFAPSLHCNAELAVEIDSKKPFLSGLSEIVIENAVLKARAFVELTGSELTAVIDPGEWLSISSLSLADIRVNGAKLLASSKTPLSYQFSSGAVRLEAGAINLQLPSVQFSGGRAATVLEMKNLAFTLDENLRMELSTVLISTGLKATVSGARLPVVALDTNVSIVGQTVSVSGTLLGSAGMPLFNISVDHQMNTGEGGARLFNDDLVFHSSDKRLSQHFTKWPYEWDILEGSVIGDINLSWKKDNSGARLDAQINQSVKDLAGVYQDVGFMGLDSQIVGRFEYPDRLYTTAPVKFSLESLDIGVPVQGLSGAVRIDSASQEFGLESVQGSLFGGRVWLEDVVYRADTKFNKVYVGVDGVQLGQLLDLAGYDAIQATGSISGLLPLTVSDVGVTMKRGMLAAKAPGGVFRYKMEVSTDINPAMLPVIAALENYHYTIFQLEADYRDNGELEMAMKFRGSNPDLQQGRPIHLNLNLTDNIPMLLKSLQSGRSIADTIEKKMGGG